MKPVFIFLQSAAVILAVYFYIRYTLIKKKLKKLSHAMDEVLNGNFNIRFYTNRSENTEKLVIQLNQFLDLYQKEHILMKREQTARKQLISNISHDIKTPLASVIGYLEAAALGIAGVDKEEYLNTALRKAYDLKQRIDQLFELVRLDAGEIRFQIREINLCEVTRAILIDFVPLLEKEKYTAEFEIPEEEYMITADELAVTRCIQNLVRNVMAHGDSGKYLGVKVFEADGKYHVDVIDHGTGIKQEDLNYIFDRLYQGDESRTSHGGLGLAITYELIQKMQGDIKVIQTEQGCTVFRLTFLRGYPLTLA